MNRRMRDKVDAGGTAFESTNVSAGNESNAIYSTGISARVSPEKWKPGLEEMALELKRARAFGFTAREIDDTRKQLISGAERAVQTEASIEARAMMGRINSNVGQHEPTMSPTQRLDLLKQVLPTITKAEVDARFAKEFDPTTVAFIVRLPRPPTCPPSPSCSTSASRPWPSSPPPKKRSPTPRPS